jgi:hypothetical protein
MEEGRGGERRIRQLGGAAGLVVWECGTSRCRQQRQPELCSVVYLLRPAPVPFACAQPPAAHCSNLAWLLFPPNLFSPTSPQ